MSLCNVIVQPRAVHLVTDGAMYDARTGCVGALLSKVSLLPKAQSAVTSVGLSGLIQLEPAFLAARSIDDAVSLGQDLVAAQHKINAAENAWHSADIRGIWLTVIGWSDARRKFEAWGIADNNVRPPFNHPQYQPYDAMNLEFLVSPAVDLETAFPLPIRSISDVAQLDVESCAVGVSEKQRRTPQALHDGSPAFMVGGELELTTVDRAGVSKRTLRTWPDRVGERIVPDGAFP